MRAERLERLITIYTTPGFTDERIHLFLASGLTAGSHQREADEFMEVQTRRWSEVTAMIRDGEIVDGKSLVSLMFVQCFRRQP
jgi:ADP-ribose pyrophosphatase